MTQPRDFALGAELRGGQVIRARRSDLDLEVDTVKVRGRGRKRGTVVKLTRGQRGAVDRALAGYLAPLEGKALDYPLFPAGKLVGRKAIGGDVVRTDAETASGVRRRGHQVIVTEPLRAQLAQSEAKPLNRSTLDGWFMEAEAIAGVAHVKGRSWYGLRRVFLDAATDEGLSREGLQEHGGWADNQVPDQIYRDKEREKARTEARDVRARNRGEAP